MKVAPIFTLNDPDPYAKLDFVSWKFNYDSREIEFWAPKQWGALAVEILWSKFARKKGVAPLGYESDARHIFARLATTWRAWGSRLGYFESEGDAEIFEREILYMLSHQIAAPNSPQWFNTGIYDVYKIKGSAPEGHYAFDFAKGEVAQTSGAFERPQAHACFIQSVSDELISEGGIFDLLIREARLFKYGSGTGSNFSHIRARGERLAGGGESSGLMSFIDVFDRSAGVIQSGGTTRRAAKMVCLDADHPDVMEFVTFKKREEDKVGALILGGARQREVFEQLKACKSNERSEFIEKIANSGVSRNLLLRFEEMILKKITPDFPHFDTDWEGAAYKSVSGQNANFSLRVTEKFFEILSANGEWPLLARTTGEVLRTISSRELWSEIEISAWVSADPGLQFHDTINDWNTCSSDGEIRASNPCSEYMFLDETACNLASVNLLKFLSHVNGKDIFDYESFAHTCELWTMVLDITVSMASYPSKKMAVNGMRYRTLGLGFANLGATLMAMATPYDSERARSFAGTLSALMTGAAYRRSCELAKELGAFEAFDENTESVHKVLDQHHNSLLGKKEDLMHLTHLPHFIREDLVDAQLLKFTQKIWQDVSELSLKYGIRNAQVSVIAPTGTIGLMMDCDTTGIEPEFSLVKYKKIAGGSTVKIVNQLLGRVLRRIGKTESECQEIERAILNDTGTLSTWLSKEDERIFDCALASSISSGRYISSHGHLKMMAAVQPFISGAISKTVNIPFDSSPREIGAIYQEARKLMLKAVAVYRDGSKLGQPLMRAREVVCRNCGIKGLITTGSCFVCSNCGTSTGCS